MTGIIVLSSLPVYKRMLLVRCLVPPGDDNQLTITADYYSLVLVAHGILSASS
ncbi:hypothetical protein IH181_004549 [Salmonella enterica subsp. enterica serovar Napoli]|nr:hypothetical protein [Salmonella enterica]EGN2958191.1 hypothetical protein [Salmonella enterica subsp. enterica serovar Napoli]